MCGESWHAMKDTLNPLPQFSRLGTWCPTFFCTSVLFVSGMYLDGGMGGGGWLLTSLFLFHYLYSWASMLYKHTIHVVKHQSVLINTCRINVPLWTILKKIIVYS